jgi:hypothetical protein
MGAMVGHGYGSGTGMDTFTLPHPVGMPLSWAREAGSEGAREPELLGLPPQPQLNGEGTMR